MQQEIGLAPRECARNSGTFILIRMSLGFLVYIALGSIFPIPGSVMLTSIVGIKANVFLFIGLIAAVVFTSITGLVVGLPLNNVMKSVNSMYSKNMRNFRILESIVFTIGIILLIFENPFYHVTLGLGLVFYGLSLFLLGYLVFISGYLNKILATGLMLGAIVGYIPLVAIQLLFPSLAFIPTIFAYIAIISEVSLAIIFIIESRKIIETDPVETITTILRNLGEATTVEITEAASKVSAECPDRVPATLGSLEMENFVTKRFSKEKKGYVWSLVED